MKKGLKKSENFSKKMALCPIWSFFADVIQRKNQKVINNSNVYSKNSYNRLVINH